MFKSQIGRRNLLVGAGIGVTGVAAGLTAGPAAAAQRGDTVPGQLLAGTSGALNSATVAGALSISGTLPPTFVQPSGDTTGATDPGLVQAALTQYGVANLLPGIYYGNTTVNISLSQAVHGSGNSISMWMFTGTGPAFLLENSGAYSARQWAEFTGVTIDGTGAADGAIGIQAGDIAQLRIDSQVRGFTTTGSVGLLLKNSYWWTEQGRIRLFIDNCATGVRLDQSGAGTNSFARTELDLYFNQFCYQDGLAFAGGTVGVVLLEGVVRLHGNYNNNGSAGGHVVKFITASASALECYFDVGLEVLGGAGPQTINFGASSNVMTGHGFMSWYADSYSFLASNNNGNFRMDGPVTGDISLLTNIISPAYNSQDIAASGAMAKNTSAFPAGWSGSVSFYMPRADGIVYAQVALSVAGGTAVGGGEVIMSGLPAWAHNKSDNRFILVNRSGGGGTVPLEVTSGGNVTYEGSGFTASGTVFLYGQTIFFNSW